MRISAKGRYALASMIIIAQNEHESECVAATSIASQLGLSKIYLEQVLSLLKRADLISSVKGALGGYRLTRSPAAITALDILGAVELSLFETTGDTVRERAPEIEAVLRASIFNVLDNAVRGSLRTVTLADLVSEVEIESSGHSFMFYI